ncbi:LPS translocon maturation chaperone LptM [Methylobrevis pamukkalensis]|nr:lipoprotein [Methylobrevis pamukkalensis]
MTATRPSSRALRALILLPLAAALLVAGCGRRGALQPPGSEERQLETPSLITAPLGRSAPDDAPDEKAPDKPFVLDPLL